MIHTEPNITRQDVVNIICKKAVGGRKINIKTATQKHFAPINIALLKYWGKRNEELKLPTTSSLSITLTEYGTTTQIVKSENNTDEVYLNDTNINPNSSFYIKVFEYLDLFRHYFNDKNKYKIITYNNIATASGLASSASGFGALVLAINDLYNLELDNKNLSILARLGSGSACRSVFGIEEKNKFVIWHKGIRTDGIDSFAEPIYNLPDFTKHIKIKIVEISNEKKSISSTDAMQQTIETSNELITHGKTSKYQQWITQTEQDLIEIFNAKNFNEFGEIVERNALMMHYAIQEAGINYFLPKTLEVINTIQENRKLGIKNEYFTIDAGANIKVLSLT